MNSLINETIINIYMHYHLHIISLAFINNHEDHKPYEHQDFYMETEWLGRKPRKLHYLTLSGLNTGWGNNPLQFIYEDQRLL